jgi:hypothetical protein
LAEVDGGPTSPQDSAENKACSSKQPQPHSAKQASTKKRTDLNDLEKDLFEQMKSNSMLSCMSLTFFMAQLAIA